MDKKTEPENKADLYRMLQTSNGWFDGQITYESMRDTTADPEVGMVDCESTHVSASPYQDCDVMVYREQHVISKVRGRGAYSLDVKRVWAKPMTFEEFKNSEWWEPTITKFKDGSCDASEIFVKCDETSPDEDGGIGSESYVHISAQCERHYRDWLNNSRLAKNFDKVSLWLQGNGDMGFTFNDKTYEFSADELVEYIEKARAFDEAGVTLEDGTVTVKLPQKEDND